MARNSTGVELRFIMHGDKVKIRMSAEFGGRFHVYRGGVQGAWFDHEGDKNIEKEPKDFIIERTEAPEKLKIINDASGYDWDSEVIRVIFDKGKIKIYDITGDIEPAKKEQYPQKTLWCYGSSITHGSNALDMSHSWASIVAHELNMDVRNLGMAGSCAIEPEFAEYIASEGEKGNWDIAILELGINVLEWNSEKIIQRSRNMIGEVAKRNPEKPVFVISPFYYGAELLDNCCHGQKWRKLLKLITEELNLPNVTYIDGLDCIDNISYMSADTIHPNIYGVMKISDKITDVLKAHMQK